MEDPAYPNNLPTAMASFLRRGMNRILAIHKAEDARSNPAMSYIRLHVSAEGYDVQEINQAYEPYDISTRLTSRDDPAVVLPRIFAGIEPRMILLTGWGSDPKAADRLLPALHRHLKTRPHLGLMVFNNATAPIFVQSNTPAHATANDFVDHVAKLLEIDVETIDLVELNS